MAIKKYVWKFDLEEYVMTKDVTTGKTDGTITVFGINDSKQLMFDAIE